MCCTCVANYLPCSSAFKSMCFTLSCLLVLFFPWCLIHPPPFLFFILSLVCGYRNQNINAFKGPSQMCLQLMQLLVTLFVANDIGIFNPPPPTFHWDKITIECTYGRKDQKATDTSEKCHLAVLLVAGIKGVTISNTNQNTVLVRRYPFYRLNLCIWIHIRCLSKKELEM